MQDEVEIFVECPVARVFAYMDDVSREHEWQPNIVEARQEPPGATRLGTRKSYVSEFMGRRVENTYVVQAFEPNERVVYQTTPESSLQAAVEISWEPVPSGTRVIMRVQGEATGPLKLIPKRLLERGQKKGLESSLELLKNILES